MKNLFLIAVIVLGFSGVSFGQLAAEATAQSSATVLIPITIANTAPLSFGSFARSAGTVTIAPNGDRSSSNVNLYNIADVTPGAATFVVSGDDDSSFSILLPADGIVSLTGTIAGSTLPITSFLSNPTEGSSSLVGGTKTINVGATITVAANQPIGLYTGEFDVIVNYN